MTDGILLAEIQRDRDLRRYDTIIIDEAHERSLNIDFLLGYLKQLLPRRPDLKLVITSATIDTARFAEHFGDAPVVEVTGRTYPVEVRYRPVIDPDSDGDRRGPRPDDRGARRGRRADAPRAPRRHPRASSPASGRSATPPTRCAGTWPASASTSTCSRSTRGCPPPSSTRSSPHHDVRRVVLATNVAETSLTVPGIRYVVDPGTARVSRYSHRLKVQRLPIEAVSARPAPTSGPAGAAAPRTASASGSTPRTTSRPGRSSPSRRSCAPTSRRSSSPMTALGLGDIAAFPFVEPPDRRQVKDGVALLEELGALDPSEPDLTSGSPRSGASWPGCRSTRGWAGWCSRPTATAVLPDVLVIAAALSIQDPRERPPDHQQAADESHRRFADDRSDFLAYRNLWLYLQEQQKALSGSAFRRLCRAEFLHYLRIREWQDLVGQLRQVAKSLGISTTGELSRPATTRSPCTRRCCRACSRTSACGTRTSASTPVPAAPGSRPGRGRRCSRSRRAG